MYWASTSAYLVLQFNKSFLISIETLFVRIDANFSHKYQNKWWKVIVKIINKLYLQGVKVYTNTSLNDVHTSGHGNKEELKLMLRLIKPKYFMPFHGEYRMLKTHADLAVECGMPKENTFVLENGEVLSLRKGIITKDKNIQAGDIYVDGNRIGEIGNAVMRERKVMSNDGIVVVIANIDTSRKTLIISPNNISSFAFKLYLK